MGAELVKWVKSHKIDAHIITFVAKMPYIDSIKLLEAERMRMENQSPGETKSCY